MGLRGSYTSQVIFEDCIIPEENVIGEVGMGYMSALKILGEGRVGLAARAVGSCGKLIELSAIHHADMDGFAIRGFGHCSVAVSDSLQNFTRCI